MSRFSRFLDTDMPTLIRTLRPMFRLVNRLVHCTSPKASSASTPLSSTWNMSPSSPRQLSSFSLLSQ